MSYGLTMMSRTLVDFKLDSQDAFRRALSKLHAQYGVPHVVISSIPVSTEKAAWLPARFAASTGYSSPGVTYASENLLCIASSYGESTHNSTVHTAIIPQIRGYFSGVGDLFSALILGSFDKDHEARARDRNSTALPSAVTHAIRTTHAILRKTAKASALVPGSTEDGYTDEELDARDENRRARRMKARELRIIGSADIILSAGQKSIEGSHAVGEMEPWNDFWTV
jgi:pyridoxine kinase